MSDSAQKVKIEIDEMLEISMSADTAELRIAAAFANRETTLDLSNCKLTHVPVDVLHMNFLQTLDLSSNDLIELPNDFNKLNQLISLDLSDNVFNEIPPVISDLLCLQSLTATENNISELPFFLTQLPVLSSLTVDNNIIVEVPKFIGNCSRLWRLSLSGNSIVTLPSTLGQLEMLVSLELGNNSIRNLPQEISRLQKLKLLDIAHNNIEVMDECICELYALVTLNLSGNRISIIPESIANLSYLELLYFWDNQIEMLPEALCELISLRILLVAKNRIRSLPEKIGQLLNLQNIGAWDNCISRLPSSIGMIKTLEVLNLSFNGFTTFPREIFSLENLRELYLSKNDISVLPMDLCGIATLTHLEVSNNCIYRLPVKFGELTNLELVDFSKNRLRNLPDLEELKKLKILDISENVISEMPVNIGSLSSLEVLRAARNQLKLLPESIIQLKFLRILQLHGNHGLGLPEEILGPIGTSEQETEQVIVKNLLSYYFDRKNGTRSLNEMKLVVVGRGAAGKTSLINRLIRNSYNPEEVETPGIEISQWNIIVGEDESVRLHAWDFGGQEILHATHQFFFSERCLYLLVLTGRDGQQQNDAEYWLQLIGSFGGDSKVILVMNKSAQHRFDLNRQVLKEKYPKRIVAFCETDCQTMLGIDTLTSIILSQIEQSEHRKIPFPEVWFNVKEVIASAQLDYLSWERFSQICNEMGESDSDRQLVLAGYLHALGIALNYSNDPRLADTHVLNPKWVTEGVYTLLRNGQEKGRAWIDVEELCNILDRKDYPRGKHDFLLRLMELYQLCFKVPSHENSYLIPELLPRDQPDVFELVSKADISFCYLYSVLPEGLLPRFIVQTNVWSEGCERWRSGCILKWEKCEAVVMADAVDRLVRIHVRGPRSHRREFLAVIRNKFDEQHANLKGISISEKIPLKNFNGRLLDYRDLILRENRKEESFYPEGMEDSVVVRELLDGIESAAVREARKKITEGRGNSSPVIINNFSTDKIVQQYGDNNMGNSKTSQNISGGTFHNSAVVARADNFNWQTNIAASGESEIKQDLTALSQLVTDFIAIAEKKDGEVVARNMEIFTREALSESPDLEYLGISAKRLGDAAGTVAKFSIPIIETVQKIVAMCQ